MTDKSGSEYWNIIALPVAGFVMLQIISLLAYSSGLLFYELIFTGSIIFSAYIGWTTVREHDGDRVETCYAGMLFGLSIGTIPALMILDVLTTYRSAGVHTTVLDVAPSLWIPSLEVLLGVVPVHSIITGAIAMLSGYAAEKTNGKRKCEHRRNL
jgi:hypothetical protein